MHPTHRTPTHSTPAAYHFTDVVSFVSGTSLVVLDPHETHLPSGDAGLRCSLLDDRVRRYGAQFAPLFAAAQAFRPGILYTTL
jgi:hypothetical protein